jgi:phage tail-like protein
MYLNTAGTWPTFALTNIAIDPAGHLVLTKIGDEFVSTGSFMGGPFQALDGDTPWYRFGVKSDALPASAHLHIFTWTGPSGSVPPYAPLSDNPFAGWFFAPFDALQGIIFNPPARNLWIGGVVRSDGTGTPSIHQIRIDYGRDTYLRHLPAIYRSDPASRDFLERLLSLAQIPLGDLRHEIVQLTQLFDPAAAPDRGYPSWLNWLSGWLAWQPNDNWTEEQARKYLAEAFDLYSLRGTVEGLRRYLKIYAGVNAYIDEPALTGAAWTLGKNSSLGFTTFVTPASTSRAILDATAVLDASELTNSDDRCGTASFGLAYCFYVSIHAAELTRPGAPSAVRAIISREKPAHTVCELCIIQPRMRVGQQCRIGIDTVVANPNEAQLGAPLRDVVLAAKHRECDQKEVSHDA